MKYCLILVISIIGVSQSYEYECKIEKVEHVGKLWGNQKELPFKIKVSGKEEYFYIEDDLSRIAYHYLRTKEHVITNIQKSEGVDTAAKITKFSNKIRFEVGEIIYEYDNCTSIHRLVYEGFRIEGGRPEKVIFKESNQWDLKETDTGLYKEKIAYEIIGDYDSVPKMYHYFPRVKSKRSPAVLVIQLLGKTIRQFIIRKKPFSIATRLRIGYQLLQIVEHIHNKGVIHWDLNYNNIAVSANNDSKICVFDFDASKIYEPSEFFRPDIVDMRRDDIRMLAHVLNNQKSEALVELHKKAEEKGPFDYEEYRQILNNELQKLKNEPTYHKFEWQKPVTVA